MGGEQNQAAFGQQKKGFMLDRRAYDEGDEEREDEEEEGLDERADAYDPLAEFN